VVPGEEAQWCIFDPILSAIYGRWYQESHDLEDLSMQQFHFCRSLAHITVPSFPFGQWLCPANYYLCDGSWVANDMCPMLWTQMNLQLSFCHMDHSLKMSSNEVLDEFKSSDSAGMGAMLVEDLATVLSKLNSDLPEKELAAMLEGFGKDGKVNFDDLVQGLFCGSLSVPVRSMWNLESLQPPAEMSKEELVQAEGVLREILPELHDDAQGEYYPLPDSDSFPSRTSGMSLLDAEYLRRQSSSLFDKASDDPSGYGVFANEGKDVAVMINSDSHVEFVVTPAPGEVVSAVQRLRDIEQVFCEALKVKGYSLVPVANSLQN